MIDPLICKLILQSLDQCRGLMLPETTLLAQVNIVLPEPIPDAEIREHAQWCIDQGWALTKTDEFRRRKYWITESGQIRLRSL